jgi:hypothetical protein
MNDARFFSAVTAFGHPDNRRYSAVAGFKNAFTGYVYASQKATFRSEQDAWTFVDTVKKLELSEKTFQPSSDSITTAKDGKPRVGFALDPKPVAPAAPVAPVAG